MKVNLSRAYLEAEQKFGLSKISIVFLLVVLTLRLVSEQTANASYLLIGLYALLGRSQAIQALFFSWLFTMINPAIAPDASLASLGRYLVILLAAISVLCRGVSKGGFYSVNKLNLYAFYVGFFLIVHSLLFSVVADVSIFKAVSWLIVMLTLLSAWQGLSLDHRQILFKQLQSALIFLIVVSVPLLAAPSIGYLRNGTGFQGFSNHPQAFGSTVALVGVLVGGRILGVSRPAWQDMVLLGGCLVLVVLSEARTAGLAMVLGLLSTVLLSPTFAGVSRRRMMPGLHSKRFQLLAIIGVAGVLMFGSLLTDKMSDYLTKRTDSTSLFKAAEASRGALVEKMVSNIQEKPLTGIGFGISSYPDEMEVERDAVFNIPIGAPVEKGVMPVAVVEELGVIGGIIIFIWFFYVFRSSARAGVSQFAALITLVLVNFGESMFFSVGGMGMLLLIIFAGAVSGGQLASGRIHHA